MWNGTMAIVKAKPTSSGPMAASTSGLSTIA
jgi:hypothetical protein